MGIRLSCGYYERLIEFLDHAVGERFLKPEHRAMLMVEEEPQILLDRFEHIRFARRFETKTMSAERMQHDRTGRLNLTITL